MLNSPKDGKSESQRTSSGLSDFRTSGPKIRHMSNDSNTHATLSKTFNEDVPRVDWHDQTLWWIRQKRDKAAHTIEEWEELREAASQIKNNVLGNLGEYLVAFEAKAKENGAIVHWAEDANEHNEIVHRILKQHGIKHIVKSKSMLTEE